VALVGGGSPPRPGEISLAHHGVLFLDELPEFPRAALEALREPLETGNITIARAARRAEFPARFQANCLINMSMYLYLLAITNNIKTIAIFRSNNRLLIIHIAFKPLLTPLEASILSIWYLGSLIEYNGFKGVLIRFLSLVIFVLTFL
jgi:hypothetical protein